MKFKNKMMLIFKTILKIIYFSLTSLVSILTFGYLFSLKNNVIYSIAVSFTFLIVMDITCSILEDIGVQIHNLTFKIKKRRQIKQDEIRKKKQDEIKKLENLILEKNDYQREIQKIEQLCSDFKQQIIDEEKILPKDVLEGLKDISQEMDSIIEILKKDTEEYYPIRHTFKVYFPEFQKMTYRFINIAKTDSLDEQTISDFMKLITEFNKYLIFIKLSINTTDKLSLNVGIKSLVKIMETERKKGDT